MLFESYRNVYIVLYLPMTAHGPGIGQIGAVSMESLLNLREVEVETSFITYTDIYIDTYFSRLH